MKEQEIYRSKELLGKANPLDFMYEPPPGFVKDEESRNECEGKLELKFDWQKPGRTAPREEYVHVHVHMYMYAHLCVHEHEHCTCLLSTVRVKKVVNTVFRLPVPFKWSFVKNKMATEITVHPLRSLLGVVIQTPASTLARYLLGMDNSSCNGTAVSTPSYDLSARVATEGPLAQVGGSPSGSA